MGEVRVGLQELQSEVEVVLHEAQELLLAAEELVEVRVAVEELLELELVDQQLDELLVVEAQELVVVDAVVEEGVGVKAEASNWYSS